MTLTMTPKTAAAANVVNPGGLRFTDSFVQYDVSVNNDNSIANLAKAIAGSLHRPEHTFYDTEQGRERELGDVLVSVDLSDPKKIVLQHMETAGKGKLGRVAESIGFLISNPFESFGMKALGLVADPEKIYLQKVVQMLATLEQDGMFGPPGAPTFNLADWKIETRRAWRDVVISRKIDEPPPETFIEASFSDTLRAAAKIPFV